MPLIFPNREVVRVRQPARTVGVNGNSPLASGLVFLWSAAPAQAASTGNGRGTGAGLLVPTANGWGYRHTGSGTILSFGTVPQANLDGTEWTILVCLDQATNALDYKGMIMKGDTLGAPGWWTIGIDNTGNFGFSGNDTGGGYAGRNFGTVSVAAQANVQYAAVGRTSGTAGYRNGVLLGTNTAVSIGSGNVSQLRLGLFRNDATTENFLGDYRYAAVWRRALTAAEIAAVYANPWQLFSPVAKSFFVPATGGAIVLAGQSATSSAGTVAPERIIGVTGLAAAAAVGAVSPATVLTETGQQAAAATGTVTTSRSVALSGLGLAASAGTVSAAADVAAALTGQLATATPGTLTATAAGSAALIGQPATTSAGTAAASAAVALLGQASTAAAGSLGRSAAVPLAGAASTAAAGTIAPARALTVTGQAATAAAGSVSASSAGTASIVGQQATTSAGTMAKALAVALTGESAATAAGTVGAGADRAVALAGQSANSAAGTVAPGQAVGLAGRAASVTPGIFIPDAAALLQGRTLNAAAGAMSAINGGVLPPAGLDADRVWRVQTRPRSWVARRLTRTINNAARPRDWTLP